MTAHCIAYLINYYDGGSLLFHFIYIKLLTKNYCRAFPVVQAVK